MLQLILASAIIGQSPVRVEETWTLLISQPDDKIAAPQISVEMLAGQDRYAQLHLNAAPGWAVGGLCLQAYVGQTLLATKPSETRDPLRNPNELIQWTQYLAIQPAGKVAFGIATGYSDTWGDFSGGEIQFAGNLSLYSPDWSAGRSGILFGAQRVVSLVLVQVTTVWDDGSVTEDYTPRVVWGGVAAPPDN